MPGYVWRVVVDGSCYDEFGIVDLNKVFDLPNPPWTRHSKLRPQAAYAVTVLQSHQHPHATIAFAGDDGLRVWRNGRHLLTQTCDSPLETKRQIVGVQLDDGMNAFVFRAPQTRFYWQLLFEPDTHFPYGNPRSFRPVPIDQWRGEGQQPRQAR